MQKKELPVNHVMLKQQWLPLVLVCESAHLLLAQELPQGTEEEHRRSEQRQKGQDLLAGLEDCHVP